MTGYPEVILPIWLGGWPRFRKAVQKSRWGESHQIGAEKRARHPQKRISFQQQLREATAFAQPLAVSSRCAVLE
jgi:hypothetical protein